MQKNLILSFILALFLWGCAPAGRDVVLADVADMAETANTAVVEAQGDTPESSAGDMTQEPEVREPVSIYVYVCGAVTSPGVYELPEGSRIIDAIKASGGFCDDADETFVNQAARLSDGVKLFIPTREEVANAVDASGQIQSFDTGETFVSEETGTSGSGGLININSATRDELTSIPGIGTVTADKIVSYREQHGSFMTIEDIKNVSGIKEKLFSKIRDYITV
ncbi:helix-hairpin-helix domain-containing protein [Butyrivibrio sp. CB08]|uniref:helix-hairpin-helix domain-containing protein n=1 Tax=Butyrivibrio sp. CB08 TaxID=2364879 RepID=UPI001314B6EA|nr:helix-hairpin-helix domain-containing protein [Butyrivibrio sp. CB08]